MKPVLRSEVLKTEWRFCEKKKKLKLVTGFLLGMSAGVISDSTQIRSS